MVAFWKCGVVILPRNGVQANAEVLMWGAGLTLLTLWLLTQLIEDLRKQLEHLQLFKLEAEQRRGRSSSVGLQEYNSRTRESELEQEVRRLKQVLLGRYPHTPWGPLGSWHGKKGYVGGTTAQE